MGMIISLQESYTLAMCPSSAAPRAEYLLVAMSHERRYSTMQRTCRYSGRDWTWRRPVPSRTGAKCHCLLAQPEKASSLCTASDDVICVAILGPNLNRSGLAPSSQPPALVGQCGCPACARHSAQKFNFSAHAYVLVARIAWTLNQTTTGLAPWTTPRTTPSSRPRPSITTSCVPERSLPKIGSALHVVNALVRRDLSPEPIHASWSSEPGGRRVRAASRGHLDHVIEVLKAQDANLAYRPRLLIGHLRPAATAGLKTSSSIAPASSIRKL
jgi:hypothetical protein